MILQNQKRNSSHNRSMHYLNGKKNSNNINQEEKQKVTNIASRALGYSLNTVKNKISTEDDENRINGYYQQNINNRSFSSHTSKQSDIGILNKSGMNLNCNERERGTINHSSLMGIANGDSKKKRSRVIYCHVCCQYKPRSTRARFQVCQHIACYDCVRLALMIQQRYNVKAHCPFCQIELDWNKVKPFIVLFKPKADSDEKASLSITKSANYLDSTNNNQNGFNTQYITNDLMAQAFECNGVSKEKILKGFFSCYLQKQMGRNSLNTKQDHKELQNLIFLNYESNKPSQSSNKFSTCSQNLNENSRFLQGSISTGSSEDVLINSVFSSLKESYCSSGYIYSTPVYNEFEKNFDTNSYKNQFNSSISSNCSGGTTLSTVSILSSIYDENNRQGFACGLFNPSIPTDGGLIIDGKITQNREQLEHFVKYQDNLPQNPFCNYNTFLASKYNSFNDENIRTIDKGIFTIFEGREDRQVSNWMVTPCLNMKDILDDWRTTTFMLKNHSDMVICSI